MEEKIKNYINEIVKEFYSIVEYEEDYFNLTILFSGMQNEHGIVTLTTSGDMNKIREREKIVKQSFPSHMKSIIDSLFTIYAKIFENVSRNKPISVPNLIKIILDNLHSLSQKDLLESSINQYNIELKPFEEKIEIIKEHRDKCLSHNDPVRKCNHLQNITKNDTELLKQTIRVLINNLAPVFSADKIEDEKLKKIKSEKSKAAFNLLKKLEG